MTSNVVQFPLVGIEDNLLNIGALAKFALFMMENTEQHEMLQLKSELVTMLYLIKDQVELGHNHMNEHARRRSHRKSEKGA